MKTNIARTASRIWRGASFTTLNTLALLAVWVLVAAQLASGQCVLPPSGLVSWWPAEGNFTDAVGGNDGTLVGSASYVPGKVGSAWNLPGNGYITVPSTASLRPPQFTIECWIKPVSAGRPRYTADVDTIAQTYNGSTGGIWLGLCQDTNYTYLAFPSRVPQGTIAFYVWITGSGFTLLSSPPMPADGVFHHLAASVDDQSMSIYLDGVLAVTRSRPAGAIVHSALPFTIGRSTDAAMDRQAAAAIDEMSFYNRALAPAELASLFAAGTAGKCSSGPPNIVLQPQSQSVFLSQSATFTVGVTGTKPFAYQWQFQGTNLPAATNAALVLAAVSTNQAGNYQVIITNALGSTTSAVAVLTGALPPGNWTGGGDGRSWADAANWSGGWVPGPTNDVVISGVGTNVTINLASSVTVQSIQCSASLTVSAGTLNLTKGASQVVGYFTVAPGQAMSASGTNTTFTTTGLATLDYSSLTALNGAVVTAPAVRSVTNGYPYVWEASGLGSRIVLAGATNIFGNEGYFRLNATAGGRMELPAVTSIANTVPLVLADGSNSVVDLSAVVAFAPPAVIASYPGSLEARNGGTVLVPLWAEAPGMTVILRPGGTIPTAQFTRLGGITLDSMSVNFPALTNLDYSRISVLNGGVLAAPAMRSVTNGYPYVWEASGLGSRIVLAGVTNIFGSASYFTLNAKAGGRMELPAVTSVKNTYLLVLADGADSYVDFSGLVAFVVTQGTTCSFTAQSGGRIDLHDVESISGGSASFLATGAGSVIDLSHLSGFITPLGASSLTAQNGGVILLNDQAWLLANVAINIPAGNPVLPPTLVASSTLALYGKAWHSYWVEKRDTRFADSLWVFAARVPLTNDFKAFAPAPPANTAFRVWEFVADPPILDLNRVNPTKVQLVLYGAPPKNFELQATDSLDVMPAGWVPSGLSTGPMTNSFRLFPPFTPTGTKQFHRAKEL